jgi:hypothetical protein
VHRFTPMQMVHGAVLTCGGAELTSQSTICREPKLNGLGVVAGWDEPSAICAAVTESGVMSVNGGIGPAVPAFTWDGSKWAVTTTTLVAGAVQCGIP